MSAISGKTGLLIAILSALGILALYSAAAADVDFTKWLEEEVPFIISDAEREYFLSLKRDSERERFVEAFWEFRDPTPETITNEFKDEHYRRLARARQEFGVHNRSSLQATMGEVYVLLGEPLKSLSLGDSKLNGPIYAWYYPPDKSCGINYYFFVVFFKPSGKVYRVYNPATYNPSDLISGGTGRLSSEEKEEFALNSLLRIDPLLGQLSLSLLPREHSPIMKDNKAELRRALAKRTKASKKVLSLVLNSRNYRQKEMLQKLKTMMGGCSRESRADTWIRGEFGGRCSFDAFCDDAGLPKLYFAFVAGSENISMSNYRGRCYAVLHVEAIARDESGQIAGQLTETISAGFNHHELGRGGTAAVSYQGKLDLSPGRYNVELTLRNPVDRRYFEIEEQVEIPSAVARVMRFGPAILVHSRQDAPAVDGEGSLQYEFNGERYSPNVARVVQLGDDSEVLYQLHLTQRQRVSDITVRLEVISMGRVIWQTNARLDRKDLLSRGLVSSSMRVGTGKLREGHYTLRLNATDVSPPIVRTSIEFDVVAGWNVLSMPKPAHKTQ
ncbi:MAG TPA: GWxTD domain-containing protein [Acidobacteriota bacterium]|nr:GWxTD domain-containing protein [Acidobacteriota bacterium]